MNMTTIDFRRYATWILAAIRIGYEVVEVKGQRVAITSTGRVMGRFSTRGGYLKTFA